MSRWLRRPVEAVRIYTSLLVFALICLGWTVVALPLYLVIPRGRGTGVGRLGIERGFRLFTSWLTLVGVYCAST